MSFAFFCFSNISGRWHIYDIQMRFEYRSDIFFCFSILSLQQIVLKLVFFSCWLGSVFNKIQLTWDIAFAWRQKLWILKLNVEMLVRISIWNFISFFVLLQTNFTIFRCHSCVVSVSREFLRIMPFLCWSYVLGSFYISLRRSFCNFLSLFSFFLKSKFQ